MPHATNLYRSSVIVAGLAAGIATMANWSCPSPARLYIYLGLTATASLLLRFRNTSGTNPVSGLVFVAGLLYFTPGDTLIATCLGAAAWQLSSAPRRPTTLQFAFNVARAGLSTAVSFAVARQLLASVVPFYEPAVLALGAALYFAINTALASGMLAISHQRPFGQVYGESFYWTFAPYVTGIAMLSLIPLGGRTLTAEGVLILLPLAYLLHSLCGLPSGAGADSTGAEPLTVPIRVRVYTVAAAIAAAWLLVSSLAQFRPASPEKLVVFVLLATVAATWKIRLPQMTGTISVNYVVSLFAIAEMSLPEALTMSVLGGAIQSVWRAKKRPSPVQVMFNGASLVLSTAAAWCVYHFLTGGLTAPPIAVPLMAAAAAQYLVNTMMVAVVLCLVDGKPLHSAWQKCHFWAFPTYLVGASAAVVMVAADRSSGWVAAACILPLLQLLWVCVSEHLGRRAKMSPQSAS